MLIWMKCCIRELFSVCVFFFFKMEWWFNWIFRLFVCLFVMSIHRVVVFLHSKSITSQNKMPIGILHVFFPVISVSISLKRWHQFLPILFFFYQIDYFKRMFTIFTDSLVNLWLLTITTKEEEEKWLSQILLSCLMEDNQLLSLFILFCFHQHAIRFQ